jgi:hypothetical protein
MLIYFCGPEVLAEDYARSCFGKGSSKKPSKQDKKFAMLELISGTNEKVRLAIDTSQSLDFRYDDNKL